MKTPVLTTARCILVPHRLDNAKVMFDRWCSDDRVTKYVCWTTHGSVQDTIQWLKSETENTDSDKMYQWAFALKPDGYVFGSGGLHYNYGEDCFELGYIIMHDKWNQGYATEIAKEIVGFAQTVLGAKQLVALHAVENPASGAVMRKCGFVYERDGTVSKFDGSRTFDTKFYRLKFE